MGGSLVIKHTRNGDRTFTYESGWIIAQGRTCDQTLEIKLELPYQDETIKLTLRGNGELASFFELIEALKRHDV
jgi:hypothetical protein